MLRPTTTLATAALLLVLALSPAAAAHATKVSGDGKVKVTWGWANEPAFTTVPNRVEIIVRDNATNVGIDGLESALHVSLHHGERELEIHDLRPQEGGAAGRYESEDVVTPSAPGIYILHVEGTVNGTGVDMEIAATHEMEALSATYFPPAEPTDAAALAARVQTLEEKVAALDAKLKAQATTPATTTSGTSPATKGTPAFEAAAAIAALGAVAVALALRRRE